MAVALGKDSTVGNLVALVLVLVCWNQALWANPPKEVVSKEGGFAITMACEAPVQG